MAEELLNIINTLRDEELIAWLKDDGHKYDERIYDIICERNRQDVLLRVEINMFVLVPAARYGRLEFIQRLMLIDTAYRTNLWDIFDIVARVNARSIIDWLIGLDLTYWEVGRLAYPLAYYGRQRRLKRLLRRFKGKYHWEPALEGAVQSGHLSITQWIVRHFNLKYIGRTIILDAARNGQLATLVWLRENFKSDVDYCRDIYASAAANGHFDTVIWLFGRLPAMKRNATQALIGAIGCGSMEIVLWLTDRYNLKDRHLTGYIRHTSLAFKKAARGGHLEMLKWVDDTFKLKTMPPGNPFAEAAGRGYLEVCIWLADRFKIKNCDPHTVSSVIVCGHLEVLKWMVDYFNLTREALHESAQLHRYRDKEVSQWLAKEYGISQKSLSSF